MPRRPYNLAIETSSRDASIAVGRDDQLLEHMALPQRHRHNVELMPAIDSLFRRHGGTPSELGALYLSIGPGSFTGLRIAVATAKALAYALAVQVVAVPTLEVVAANAPQRPHLAVCLSAKRQHQRMYTGIYHQMHDGRWRLGSDPELLTPHQLCDRAPRPLAVLGAHLPDFEWPDEIEPLDPSLAAPRSEVVWRLGRERAAHDDYADPWTLVPLYARRPEAEEVWERRRKQPAEGRP